MLKCIKYAKFDQNIPRGPRVMRNIDNNAKTWTLLKLFYFVWRGVLCRCVCCRTGRLSLFLLVIFVSYFFVNFFFLFFILHNAVMCSHIDQ